MNIKKEVSINKIQKEAEEMFGGFYCSEAVMYVIKKNFELDVEDYVISMASGFPVGLGGSGCLCGAVSGGTMALGLIFGRTKPNDPKVNKCMELTRELHDWFKIANQKNILCCRALIKEFQDRNESHAGQCAKFTGLIARKVAEIIVRELNLINLDEK